MSHSQHPREIGAADQEAGEKDVTPFRQQQSWLVLLFPPRDAGHLSTNQMLLGRGFSVTSVTTAPCTETTFLILNP